MNNFYDNVGARIRDLRETNRYTREQLSELAEISPKFLYEIETGKKGFSADTLYRIAKSLAVSSEYILSGNNQYIYDGKVINTLNLFNNSQVVKIEELLKLIYEIII
ncbi:DNA-binding transcriptional regulator, XRE-family HTH domain [Anaerosporobacter mobilis DSM 15930]|uniref:DNA-binding transcriptional regulator, XRE-family HTH domain n=1 Tax=Anaerosporobacter mobilis DSM 15930 TaxID=1120996 RepID=A0A1M7I6V3_9FIRM|nr:helix-turn-helix transcriptional regulator [Anaerosporobacter mobilis]MBS5934165.1 helix-turn-helix transcriptional regulator [Clostridiales bacterium]SHM36378.1 DNA-binding transcriptional regulator, XRE-family HTH domain [Anaerosporobacter mobilis DSM 15930]